MSIKEYIEGNKPDLIAAGGRVILGSIPFVGPLLAELFTEVIPNQRIDRLSQYVSMLDNKLSRLPEKVIDKLKTDEGFHELLEESLIQASRATTDERRHYIASILEKGITDDAIEFADSKYLLHLLQEINDIEILWLRYYLVPAFNGDIEFREKHQNVLSPIFVHLGSDKETLQKAAIQENYKIHLERLGLLNGCIKIDSKTKIPKFNAHTGQTEVSYWEITQLGIMLLEQIGLSEES